MKMINDFSRKWNRSVQPKKQRKFRYNAPLHIKQKFTSAHLSKELRAKYNIRSFNLKKGDRVKVMRGKFKKKIGKIERVDLKKTRIYVEGVETVKKDGTKSLVPIKPSKLMITELNMDDKYRQKIIERRAANKKQEKKHLKGPEKVKHTSK